VDLSQLDLKTIVLAGYCKANSRTSLSAAVSLVAEGFSQAKSLVQMLHVSASLAGRR